MSFDEPLNTDWDGNELLLSDVLGTEADVVMRPIEEDVERDLLAAAINVPRPREKQIITLRFGLGAEKSRPRKRWRTSWASRRATSPGWKSASSPG